MSKKKEAPKEQPKPKPKPKGKPVSIEDGRQGEGKV